MPDWEVMPLAAAPVFAVRIDGEGRIENSTGGPDV